MRGVGTDHGGRRHLLFVGIVVVACALAGWAAVGAPQGAASPTAAPALADSGSPSPSPSPTPTAITLHVSKGSVTYGQSVTVSGVVDPVAEGQSVTIAVAGATVKTVVTDVAGAYSATFTPHWGGAVSAALADGTVSPTAALSVKLKVTIATGKSVPWGRGRVIVQVRPGSYAGVVTAKVYHHSRRIATLRKRAAAGRVVFSVRTPGVGRFTVYARAAAVTGLSSPTAVHAAVSAPWRKLAVGSQGRYVKILLTRLAALKFRVPGVSTTLSYAAGDSVVAFQKAYRLSRTYVFDGDDWRKLDVAKVIKARHTSPATHIEIDKTRQILMIVKGGKPLGIIPISSGATGNTPVGTFHILWKAPSTTTWLGSAILWRTMTFYRNFAMHGYPEVPPYPASHGCVREPIWVADWTYQRSWVGETVYVYS